MTVQYGATYVQRLQLLPAASPLAPLVVLVHGGGWAVGTLGWNVPQALALQAQGFAVVNVEYRKSTPTHGAFPRAVDDVLSATAWAVSHAAQLQADPANLTLVGGSAGGHLVALAAERLNARSAGTVDRVVTLSAPTDLPSLVTLADAGTLQTSFRSNLYQALACSPGTCDGAVAAAWSPARQATAPCASWLLFASAGDFVPRGQSQLLGDALVTAGCPVTTTVLPGSLHSFAYWPTVETSIYDFIRRPV